MLLAFVNDANARVQATSDVSGNVMGSGFAPGPFVGLWDSTGSATIYSGRVIADLSGQDGAHMRCAFRLIHPSSGMSGGGAGLCQTPAGKVIDVSLNKA